MDVRADPKHTRVDGSRHFPGLDGLRGLAILLVLLHHCYPSSNASAIGRALSKVIDAGWIGVELFFVLSGFLITGILLDATDQPGGLRQFYERRVQRILPLYYTFLATYQLVAIFGARRMVDGSFLPRTASWPIWLFLTNMPQFLPVGPLSGSLGPLWSLAVEVQVYLIWPLLVLSLSRRSLLRVLLATLPITLLVRMCLLQGWNRVDIVCCWTPAFLDVFAAGGIVAILLRGQPGRRFLSSHAHQIASAAGLTLLVLAAHLGHFHVWTNTSIVLGIGRTFLAILFASIIGHIVISGPKSRLNKLLSSRFFSALGKYSFAMYLFHTSIFATLRPYLVLRMGRHLVSWSTISGGVIFVATVAVVYLAAALSWRLLEEPLLRRSSPTRSSPWVNPPHPDRAVVSQEVEPTSGARTRV